MSSVVIVTKQCYLLCEAINYIAVNEVEDERRDDLSSLFSRGRKRKRLTKKQRDALNLKQFQIVIDFIPVSGTNSNQLRKQGSNPDSTTVAITVTGRERCLALYQDMVAQIREQLPDKLFVDKLVERFLTETKGEVNDRSST